MEKTEAEAPIAVEVVYALPERQRLIAVLVPAGTTAFEAVQRSGIAREFPAIDLATARMGIFSQPLDGKTLPLPQDYRMQPRDRVEIYRPLMIDPKAARLARATKLRAAAKPKDKAAKEAAKEE